MAADSTGTVASSSSSSSGAGRSSNSTADSYLGSLISLTSKSEIRYEGVLYNINTDESSIGLKNVRSFGTEGRKKDGPQIPPSDKVYEYILFRGSDIKDLQVKSSPPVQPAPPPPASVNNDPAIIQQSHYPRPATAPTSLSTLSDVGSHNVQQMGLSGSNFQGGLPMYQPGGSLGTWGASPAPPPNGNGSGLAMPMYWPGYYGPPTGLPHLHQQSMLRPPLGVSMPPPMQQPMQFPNFSVPFPSGASNLPSSNLPTSNFPPSNLPGSNLLTPNWPGSNLPVPNLATSLPDMPSLLPASTGSLNIVSTSSSPSTLAAPIGSDTLSSLMPNKAPTSALPAANLTASLPTLPPLTTFSTDLSAIIPPIHSKPSATSGPGPAMPYQATGQSISSAPIASSSLRTETPTHTLVTPGQLLQSGPATVSSSQSVQAVHKDVEVVQVSSSSPPEPLILVPAEAQPPILPLPAPSRPAYKPSGAPHYSRYGYRGRERGRGTGSSRPVAKFTEDFDFEAMNEKFNKDEVWGHLGKNKLSRDKDDGNVSDDDSQDEYDEDAKVDSKAVYNKDDFFDTLSCNTLGNNTQNGRPRFSEQMKLDTETFGEYSRYRGGRGGRGPPRGGHGPPRGGHSRGSYHGRGYGYGYTGRGRGRAMPSRAA